MTALSRTDLLAFQRSRGVHLIAYGSDDYGLHIDEARILVDVASANGVPILGVELWRSMGGRYRLNGLETLVPLAGDAVVTTADALSYFTTVGAGPDDLFAIQFG